MTPQSSDANNQAANGPASGRRAADRGEAGNQANPTPFRRRASDRAGDAVSQVPGVRKAAILLLGIGEPVSATVIRRLDPHEILQISNEIATLVSVAPDQMIGVFREFEALSVNGRLFARGGAEQARRLIENAVGEEEAQKFFQVAPPPPEAPRLSDWEAPFKGIEPGELATVLSEENPQTLALVLSNLPPEQAGPLMASLAPATQPQVALRIALMDHVSPEVFRQVAEVVRGKLKSSRQLQRSDGARALAAILNNMEGEKAELILSKVESENQPAAASVRVLMFSFHDIVVLDPESIKVLIGRIDRKILTMALKGTSEDIRAHFTRSMSQRATEMLIEDIEALGPVRIRDVHAAQEQIVSKIRELEKEGIISTSPDGGNGYVV
jgi:flagellar motor switch protein FliG